MTRNEHSLEKELQKFRVLYELAVAMTAERNLEEDLKLVVERSRELLGADSAYIALRDDQRGDVYMHTLSGIRTEAFKKMRLPFGKGLGGLVAKTRKGFIVEDYQAERNIEHVVDRIVLEEGVVSGMAVPVQMGARNLGVLYVFNRTKTVFSQSDLDTLFLIGNLAAVEISRQEAEKSLLRSREELEAKVRERTLELRQANQLLTEEIQEHRRFEDALRASEERIRTIVEHSSNLFYSHTPDHVLTYMSPQSRAFFDCEPEEALVRWTEFATDHPVNRAGFEYTQRAIDTGERQPPFPLELAGKKGRRIWVEANESPVVKDGRTVSVVGALIDITKRRQAEEALVAAEAKYRSIFENTIEGIFQTTEAGSFISANQALARMYGYESPEELMSELTDVGRQLYVDPKRREEFLSLLRDKGEVRRFENVIRRKDGSIAVTSLNALEIKDADGNLLYLQGTVEDITERKRIAEALQESETRYRTLVENLPIGVYRCTPGEKGLFLMANRAFLNMFGYENEEALKGVHVSDIYMNPEERKQFSDELLDRKSISLGDRYLKRKDGTAIWGRVTGRLVHAEGSEQPVYFDCAIEDISEQKHSEHALRESEKKYRDLFENVSDFLYTHDLKGRFIEVNSAFRRASGITADEMNGLQGRDMVPEQNKPLFDEYLKRIQERAQDEGLLKILTRQGKELILEYRNSLMHDSEGRPVGVRGSARDVTERVRAERERKKLEAQLMTAQRIEAIGTLAGGIAHNFNNLLMGIQGNATLARMDADPDGMLSQRLENIEKLVRSGAKLTSQLLGYAREGRYEVRPINLNHLVRETAGTFSQARKDIVVRQELAEDLLGIEADQGQIEQALLNLLVNSADAMPLGGRVFLRTRNVGHREIGDKSYKPKPGQYVELRVEDTGSGMDGRTMERIFEPFFTTKGLGKGTGLGLSSVYGTVKGHGGYVDVHSEAGKGSVFTLYLPASHKEVRKETEAHSPIRMGNEKVLLVDDEDVILDVGRQMIEALGYHVTAVKGGKEALDIYLNDPAAFDLVVLDMIMPDMGGGETFDRLKGINPGVKVLLSSGYSVDGQAKEILDRGCNGFIQKPFHIQELSQELRRILGRV